MRLAMAVVVAVTCKLLAFSSFDHGRMIQVRAQPADFVSIDCGGSITNYTDAETGLSWTSDSNGFGLENVGRAANVSSPAKYPWLSSMRIFEGTQTKYCYVFGESSGIVQSNLYLVRASFWAGNEPPFITPNKEQIRFMLFINADEWDSLDISLPQENPLVMEMYVFVVLPTISVCVAADRGETAFISSLKLRPINKSFTSVDYFMLSEGNEAPKAMFLYSRLDFGSTKDVRLGEWIPEGSALDQNKETNNIKMGVDEPARKPKPSLWYFWLGPRQTGSLLEKIT